MAHMTSKQSPVLLYLSPLLSLLLYLIVLPSTPHPWSFTFTHRCKLSILYLFDVKSQIYSSIIIVSTGNYKELLVFTSYSPILIFLPQLNMLLLYPINKFLRQYCMKPKPILKPEVHLQSKVT